MCSDLNALLYSFFTVPIDIQCSVSPNSEMTVYSYSCEVILGGGQQDTLACSVDGVAFEPCKFKLYCLVVAMW